MDILVAGSSGGYMISSSELMLLLVTTVPESDPALATGNADSSGKMFCNYWGFLIDLNYVSLDLLHDIFHKKTIENLLIYYNYVTVS